MGMFTQVKVECDVRAEGDALTVLQLLFGDLDPRSVDVKEIAFRLHHRLFFCTRWACIGSHHSSTFDEPAASSLESLGGNLWRIRSISDFKDYDNEIAQFFDWLRPMVVGEPGQVIGHSLYEGDIDDPPVPVVL
jgi:hypothetical protein